MRLMAPGFARGYAVRGRAGVTGRWFASAPLLAKWPKPPRTASSVRAVFAGRCITGLPWGCITRSQTLRRFRGFHGQISRLAYHAMAARDGRADAQSALFWRDIRKARCWLAAGGPSEVLLGEGPAGVGGAMAPPTAQSVQRPHVTPDQGFLFGS